MPWRRRLPVVRPPGRQPTFQGFYAAGEGVAAEKTEAVVEVVDGVLATVGGWVRAATRPARTAMASVRAQRPA
jgi:hypothetical protein